MTNTSELTPMLEGLARLLATSSRDWGQYAPDAWLYAVICGWDCEETEHDETCTHGAMEEMAERHGWDEATVAKARRYRAAVRAVVEPPAGQTTPSHRAGLRDHITTAISKWHRDPEQPLYEQGADAVLAVLPEPTDKPADSRDRVAEAALAAVETALGDTLLPDAREEALDRLMKVLPPTTDRAAEPVCICGHPNEQHFEDVCQTCGCGDYLEPQDAAEVIARWRQAALKARADRAAVLTDAADRLEAQLAQLFADWPSEPKNSPGMQSWRDAIAALRRMADETATETPEPHRGDAFEQWLKARRDEWAPEGCQPWQILDQTLEEYRLHADTGTPLGEHVCEARVVGDCECLEQPAAERQDGGRP